jgi:hypothetical protein
MTSQSTAAGAWYPDPCGRHEQRYWDGEAWTHHVADGGQSSVDPVDPVGPVTAENDDVQDPQPVDASGVESVLLTVPRVSDVKWGGFANVYLTNTRLVVEPVLKTGAVIGSVAAGGLVGVTIARNVAEKKLAQRVDGQARSLDEILRTSAGAYAVDYSEVATLVLSRKPVTPIGHSRCKIRSTHKNVTLAFKREMFDEVAAILTRMLPGRVKVK